MAQRKHRKDHWTHKSGLLCWVIPYQRRQDIAFRSGASKLWHLTRSICFIQPFDVSCRNNRIPQGREFPPLCTESFSLLIHGRGIMNLRTVSTMRTTRLILKSSRRSPHGRSSREQGELSRRNMFRSVKWSACGSISRNSFKARMFR